VNFKNGALVIIALLTSGCMNKLETVKIDTACWGLCSFG